LHAIFFAHWRSKTTIDDTLDVFPCHGMGGVIGMICTGIFADKVGLIYGATTTFLHHLYALCIVAVFSIGGTFALYKITNLIIPLRVSIEEEALGLDITQHNETADELGHIGSQHANSTPE
jgi:ammonium transporter, Amt family